MALPSPRSWRGGPKAATSHEGPSTAARVFWSLVFLGLIGVLVWLLWWPRPDAQLATLCEIYEKTTPIPYCDEDTAAFASLEPSRDIRKTDRGRSDTISNLWGEWKGEGGRKNDPVIVYFAARGVSDADGSAWLLCSGYEAGSREQGARELRLQTPGSRLQAPSSKPSPRLLFLARSAGRGSEVPSTRQVADSGRFLFHFRHGRGDDVQRVPGPPRRGNQEDRRQASVGAGQLASPGNGAFFPVRRPLGVQLLRYGRVARGGGHGRPRRPKRHTSPA